MKTEREFAERWFGRNDEALTDAQRRVMKSTVEQQPVTRNTIEVYEEHLTFGEKLSDVMASIGGSWRCTISLINCETINW